MYCLASRKPGRSEVLANHFVLCRFSSLRHVGVLYGFPSPPSFLFSGCFLSGLNWIQEQTRAQESAIIIQHECVSGNGESRVEGSGGKETLPFLVSQPTQSWHDSVPKLEGSGGRDGEWHSHVPKGSLCRQINGIFATDFSRGQL